jgi:exopolyphosphatase/guanosine-5'-triphosphate,3'-diphosphate pyrophosphatase
VGDFAQRCHAEEPHSAHVQMLALALFDALGERLGCNRDDRAALSDAALLHDAGYHISYERHHKHSYHLVLHADLLGMPPSEQVVVANVSRYHRGSEPRRRHRNFGMLDKTLRRRIRRLSAILRIADGLDRGHVSAVSGVKVRWTQRAIRITPVPASPRPRGAMRLEMWGAHRKSGLLAKVAGTAVEIVAPDGNVLSSDSLGGEELE